MGHGTPIYSGCGGFGAMIGDRNFPQILPFSMDEYGEVLSLWRRCGGVGLSDADSEKGLRAFLERNPGLSFTAKFDNLVVGTVLAGLDARRGYLYHLAVHPKWRRQGLGKKLVERALWALQESGITKCHLFVFQDNLGGIAFWKSLGWEERTDLKVFSRTLTGAGRPAVSKKSSLKDLGSQREKHKVRIRNLTEKDWEAVRTIYEEGIATGQATFDEQAPSWEEWDKGHLPDCRLVALVEGKVAGWAALSRVSSRCVYAGVAELSIYVDAGQRGRGIGSRLLQALILESEKKGIWTLQSTIFPENGASIGLHRKCGFRLIGRRERLGRMKGRWRDVLLFERRSPLLI